MIFHQLRRREGAREVALAAERVILVVRLSQWWNAAE
jgi:hypothetical protein